MRRDFLDSPDTWLRSSRGITHPARYACAIEIPTRPSIWVRLANWLWRL